MNQKQIIKNKIKTKRKKRRRRSKKVTKTTPRQKGGIILGLGRGLKSILKQVKPPKDPVKRAAIKEGAKFVGSTLKKIKIPWGRLMFGP